MASFKDWTIKVNLDTKKTEAGLKRIEKLQARINKASSAGSKVNARSVNGREAKTAKETNKLYRGRSSILNANNNKIREAIQLEKKLRAEVMKTNAAMAKGGRRPKPQGGGAGAMGAGAAGAAMGSRRPSSSGASAGALGGFAAARLGPVAGVLAMGAAVRGLYMQGKKLENIKATLLAASGSATQAATDWENIKSSAQLVGIDLATAADGYAKIGAAAAASGFTLEETNDAFMSSMEASRAFGLSQERTSLVNLAFSQMISKGVVSMEELRRQLGEQIPGAFNIAAKSMGITAGELDKLVSSGKLMTKDFLPGFTKALRHHVRQSGALDKAMDSTQAKQERFFNTISMLSDEVFQITISDEAGGIFEDMGLAIDELKPGIVSLMRMLAVAAKQATSSLEPVGFVLTEMLETIESIAWHLHRGSKWLFGDPDREKKTHPALRGNKTFFGDTSVDEMKLAFFESLQKEQTERREKMARWRAEALGTDVKGASGSSTTNLQNNNITIYAAEPETIGQALSDRASMSTFDTQN